MRFSELDLIYGDIRRGLQALRELLFKDKSPEEYSAECIFDMMIELIETQCS